MEGEDPIVIDCGPDFRYQMLRSNTVGLNSVLLTHEHYDHTGGLDDLRPFTFLSGQPVKIFGLEIRSGDLLYADCHGVVSIPHEIVAELPAAAAKIREHEQRIIDICRSPGFSLEKSQSNSKR